MPGVFSVSPLAPGVASYEGALFEPAHLLTARTAFEQTIAASDAAATPSCSIIYVETHILPSVSSRTHTDFTPLPIRNDATPGALILTNRDDQQFHLRHNRLPVIDSRTIDSTIARAHVRNGVHRTLAETLTALTTQLSLVPIEYAKTLLSHCSICSLNEKSITTPLLPAQARVTKRPLIAPSSPASPRVGKRCRQVLGDDNGSCDADAPVTQPTKTDASTTHTNVSAKVSSASCVVADTTSSSTVAPETVLPRAPRKKLVFKPRHVPRRVPRVQTRPPSPPLLPLLPPPPPSPKPAKSALECAGVTDEISDLVSAEGAYETHEEFLVLMHKVYEKAGLPADRLIGRKEDLEAAATQDDYYDY